MNRREAIAALVALPEVSRVTVARPKDDDVLVVECDGPISDATAERIKAHFAYIWPNRKIVVLDGGIRIKFASA